MPKSNRIGITSCHLHAFLVCSTFYCLFMGVILSMIQACRIEDSGFVSRKSPLDLLDQVPQVALVT